MSIEITRVTEADSKKWDSYVAAYNQATPYHLSKWQAVVEDSYGHQSYFLMAKSGPDVVGVLPLVHMKHRLSGNSMISMPFLDMAGVLADTFEVASGLILEAYNLMHEVNASSLQLRQGGRFTFRDEVAAKEGNSLSRCRASGDRVRMIRKLPGSSDALMNEFNAKLRNQIRKPIREGLEVKCGGGEYLEDFYSVFAVNMRDLGSPVHSKEFLQNVLKKFPEQTRVFVVYKGTMPLAASIVCLFGDTVYNPWSSSLRRYRYLCPNMLLYWSMLEYACEQGFSTFDFGRSINGEGAHRFKKQWGARPMRLCWYNFSNLGTDRPCVPASIHDYKINAAIQLWKKIPVPVSRMIGPVIRKNIGL